MGDTGIAVEIGGDDAPAAKKGRTVDASSEAPDPRASLPYFMQGGNQANAVQPDAVRFQSLTRVFLHNGVSCLPNTAVVANRRNRAHNRSMAVLRDRFAAVGYKACLTHRSVTCTYPVGE